MSLLFNDFRSWEKHCADTGEPLYQPVLEYEIEQKDRTEEFIWENIAKAYDVMKDAVHTGLTENMQSRSGMVNNSAKKVAKSPVSHPLVEARSPVRLMSTAVTGAEAVPPPEKSMG